jgi:hypothetical protein
VSTDAGGASAVIVAYRNVDTTTPLDVAGVANTSASGTDSNFTPTGLTTSTDNALAVSDVVENDGASTAPTLSFNNAQGFGAESGFPDPAGSRQQLQGSRRRSGQQADLDCGAVTFPPTSSRPRH